MENVKKINLNEIEKNTITEKKCRHIYEIELKKSKSYFITLISSNYCEFNLRLYDHNKKIIKLKKKPSLVLVDGNKLPDIKNYKINFVIKGDQKIPSISAASIIAKVTRDKIISNLGKNFKNYHWGKNYGYGTKQHLKAIKKFGITTHHRKTFSPINKIR